MITILLTALKSIITRLLLAAATEKMVEYLLFAAAEKLVKSTKNPLDDQFLAELKKAYDKPSKEIED